MNELGYDDPCPECKWHCDANGFPRHKPGCPRISRAGELLQNRIAQLEKIVADRLNAAEARIAKLEEENARLRQSFPSYTPPVYR